jgi:ribulose bisphosphate carboxylase small subunit
MSSVVKMNFDVQVAKSVGSDAAIMLSNIQFWVFKNAANGRNLHDEKYWTYNSVTAWTDIFEWLSIKQVRTCLNKLVQGGYILEGEYNTDNRDRTKWYSPTAKFCKLPNSKQHLPKAASAVAQMGNSYKEQIINTDNKPYANTEKLTLNNIQVNAVQIVKTETAIPDLASKHLEANYPSMWDSAWMKAPKYVKQQRTKVIDHFDAAVLKEGIDYDGKKLYGRLLGLINNWKPSNDAATEKQTARKMMSL